MNTTFQQDGRSDPISFPQSLHTSRSSKQKTTTGTFWPRSTIKMVPKEIDKWITHLRGRYTSVTYWKPKEDRAWISAFSFVLTLILYSWLTHLSNSLMVRCIRFNTYELTILCSSFIHSGFFIMKASCSNSLPVLISASVILRRHWSGRLYLHGGGRGGHVTVRIFFAVFIYKYEAFITHLFKSLGRKPSHLMFGVVRLALS